MNTNELYKQRASTIEFIFNLEGTFEEKSSKIFNKILSDSENQDTILGHLRMCGAIPEEINHDSSEEKLYSKYTDIVLDRVFNLIGLGSSVISARADVADVDVNFDKYSFVADAKAFRLSRTAKNQKDFKVSSMNKWKYEKDCALLVCPSYQVPSKKSQIYYDATNLNVLIISYEHLAMLLNLSFKKGIEDSKELLRKLFSSIENASITDKANSYWSLVNQTILSHNKIMLVLKNEEKEIIKETINLNREIDLEYLENMKNTLFKLTKEELVDEIVKLKKFGTKIETINKVEDLGILDIE